MNDEQECEYCKRTWPDCQGHLRCFYTGITRFYAKDNDVVVSKPTFDRSLDNFMTWYKLFIRYVSYFITNDIDNNNEYENVMIMHIGEETK